VIEQAKASYNAAGCAMTFDECIAFHAERMVQAPLVWWSGTRNGAWALDVWIEGEDDEAV
jgi:hypothetical protein